jgi:precorrin-4/cobalt-precorrin-4 C11-methyltransferase
MKIYFVGAGPGDPELITVKGARLLAAADMVIYAGSLVNRDILVHANPAAQCVDSAGMDLDELVERMVLAVKSGLTVVRLHTGDPGLYGAIQEQMDALQARGVDSVIVPGVSSYAAAAATLQRELTLPDITQTVIITRLAGRTGVPEKERLRTLASHGASMCIFLSVGMIDRVVEELSAGYPPDTPVAVVEKASWPTEQVVRGPLSRIASLVREAGITRTAIVMVGEFLRGEGYNPSRLYDPGFTHGFREGKTKWTER